MFPIDSSARPRYNVPVKVRVQEDEEGIHVLVLDTGAVYPGYNIKDALHAAGLTEANIVSHGPITQWKVW